MKKLLCLLAFLFTTPALAQSWYVDSNLGVAFNSNAVVTRNPTFAQSIGVGYDFGQVRLATEYAHLGSGAVRVHTVGLQGYGEPWTGHLAGLSVTPYLTGGAGLAFYDGSQWSSAGNSEALFNFGAGISVGFARNWSWHIEGRQYLGFGTHVVRDNGGLTNYASRTLFTGLRYSW